MVKQNEPQDKELEKQQKELNYLESIDSSKITNSFDRITIDSVADPESLNKNENQCLTSKRTDYLQWWDYFMSIAYITSLRSKDPNTQVGACIVNNENRIVGLGYNGMPNNCSDDVLPWNRQSDDPMEIKYLYVCHAEMNAILNKNSYDCKDCTIFVIMFPCNECAKVIIQSGIRRVVYLFDKHPNYITYRASRRLLDMANVELIQYTPKQRKIVVDFDEIMKRHKIPRDLN